MLTPRQNLALMVAAFASAFTAIVLAASMVGSNPCDPAPPNQPVPAAK